MKMSNVLMFNVFLAVTMALNHKSFRRCYRVTVRMVPEVAAACGGFPPVGRDVRHHLVLLSCFVLWEVLNYAQPFILEGSHICNNNNSNNNSNVFL